MKYEPEVVLPDVPEQPGVPSGQPSRRWLWLAIKLLVLVGGFAFILSRQPLEDFARAAARLSAATLAAVFGIQLFALVLGSVRWRSLFSAYGAEQAPPFWDLYRVYMVGQFYNIFIPGAVGGDVMRGVLSRRAFGERGVTAAVAIVFVERVLGFAGVLFITAAAVAFDRTQRLDKAVLPYCLLGLFGLAALITVITHGQRFAAYAPRRIASILGALPTLARSAPFVLACLLSAAIQALIALCGVTLLAAIDPSVPPFDSFLAMPLSIAASFIPLSVAGSGPRDLILVALYGALGVAKSSAFAVALGFLMTNLAASAVGGIVQLFWPVGLETRSRS